MNTAEPPEPTPEADTSEDSLQRWELEQARLQIQVDDAVHQAMSAVLQAAEALKARLLTETDRLVSNYERDRDELLGEIDATREELQALQSEVGPGADPRGAPGTVGAADKGGLTDARTEASRIVQAAEREGESLLTEVRRTENQLRELEADLRDALAQAGIETVSTVGAAQRADAPSIGTQSNRQDRADAPPVAATLDVIFENVPSYQRAAALERTVHELESTKRVDILEFEGGRLVLRVVVTDREAFPNVVLDRAPSPIRLVNQEPDRLEFLVAS